MSLPSVSLFQFSQAIRRNETLFCSPCDSNRDVLILRCALNTSRKLGSCLMIIGADQSVDVANLGLRPCLTSNHAAALEKGAVRSVQTPQQRPKVDVVADSHEVSHPGVGWLAVATWHAVAPVWCLILVQPGASFGFASETELRHLFQE